MPSARREAGQLQGTSEASLEILEGPAVVEKPAISYVGIRVATPFRGMLAERDRLMEELYAWLGDHDVRETGNVFLRLNVIDMNGPMDLEVGAVTKDPPQGDDRVRPGVLPAGRYASLTYVNHARRANGALLDWVRANDLELDKWEGPTGDHFACRYEEYLTDPRSEPRKTTWRIGLNLRLADA
jgi:effector-binding domain-containing protein